MKTKIVTLEKPIIAAHLIVIVVVALLAMALWVTFVGSNLHLDQRTNLAGAVGVGVLSLMTAWLSFQSCAVQHRRLAITLGILGATAGAVVYGWALQTARFQLSSDSYPALAAARVPADLIAEFKGVEAITAQADQQFVDNLSARLGPDHIAPYRDALIQCCWNCHRRVASAAAAGFCACLSFILGSWLASRPRP